jgi:hypothetical protein
VCSLACGHVLSDVSVPHLIRVMFSSPHKMDILQAPGKTKEFGGSGIAALERLVAGLDRK